MRIILVILRALPPWLKGFATAYLPETWQFAAKYYLLTNTRLLSSLEFLPV